MTKKKRITSRIWEDEVPFSDAYNELSEMLVSSDNPLKYPSFEEFVLDQGPKTFPQHNFNVWHIRLMCSKIDNLLASNNKYLLAVLPRYHLKSTILNNFFSIYRMLETSGEGLCISYKEELAAIHLYHTKEMVRCNRDFSRIMTDLSPQSDSMINYKISSRRCKIYPSGIFGVKRGLHTNVICVAPETKVFISPDISKKYSGGYVSVESIKVGDKVKTHMNRYKRVEEVYKRFVSENIIILYLENGEIVRVTKEHPILVKDFGWKKAGCLLESDVLMKLRFWDSCLKGKKYEEIHGIEKAIDLKKERFKNVDRSKQKKPLKGKTWEEYLGKEQADAMKAKISETKTGRLFVAREDRSCLKCGQNFVVKVNSTQRYCCGKCWGTTKHPGAGFNFRAKVGNFFRTNNPNWHDGASFQPHGEEFNDELKTKIRKRDGFTCAVCKKHGHYVHHINYDKKNNTEENLITLCRSCHARTNSGKDNRIYWKNYFSGKMLEKCSSIQNGTKITKIEEVFYSGYVYNLEVEEDNTYIGKGLIFHNCTADDIQGDLHNPMTFTELEKSIKIFDAEVLNIPNKDCPLIIFGTVISSNDVLFHLKDKEAFQQNMLWMPALYPDGEHEVLWEDMYDRQWLEQRKIDGGWKAFSTEFLLTPIMATEAFFNKEQLDTVIDKNLQNYQVPGY